MIKEMAECEECGKMGPADEIELCGDWFGSPDNGYPCPDYLCKECRTGGWDDED